MKRRQLLRDVSRLSLSALGVSTVATACQLAPFPARYRLARVAYMGGAPREALMDQINAFVAGLRELGYIDGQTIEIVWRFGPSDPAADYKQLAAEVVGLQPDVIVVGGGSVTLASQTVKGATSTIPIVAVNASDPVQSGLVPTLSHPGGNLTALAASAPGMYGKHIDLMHEFVPGLARIAVLITADSQATTDPQEIAAAAAAAGLESHAIQLNSASELASAFDTPEMAQAQALINAAGGQLRAVTAQLGQLALEHQLPGIAAPAEYARSGLLMSYGADQQTEFRHAATYVAKILKGARPADLPVEQPSAFDLVVNLNTLRALSLNIPDSVVPIVTEWVQ